ncbi:FAR1 DNA-binding domain [Phytophthora infestans]|uniref:FAR1 DNA-binding domain n=1 Tax=Phytophthora infestans TaxID=4787 RepID=A0A8S9TQW7_PHYIN|nr:FAR1 DNA-binding domain [Phytophthora infestans]
MSRRRHAGVLAEVTHSSEGGEDASSASESSGYVSSSREQTEERGDSDFQSPLPATFRKSKKRKKSSSQPRHQKSTRQKKRRSRRLSSPPRHSSSSDSVDESDSSSEDQHEPTPMRLSPLESTSRVPELDVKLFADWEDLERYLGSYSRRTHQLYSVRTATPVQVRNERIKKSRNPIKPIPVTFSFYNKTYVCTHHGRPRRSRGKGKRPKQHSRKIGCPAQINACVRETGGWEVCATKQITEHNHEISADAYENYHEARQISDEEVLSTVRTLHRAGANRKRILEYISENTEVQPAMKDVHNLVARLTRESYNLPSMEERIKSILEDFAEKPGNVTRVFSNEEVG